jgi:hypothetical protein
MIWRRHYRLCWQVEMNALSCREQPRRNKNTFNGVLVCDKSKTTLMWFPSGQNTLVMVFGPEYPETFAHVFCPLGNHTLVVLCIARSHAQKPFWGYSHAVNTLWILTSTICLKEGEKWKPYLLMGIVHLFPVTKSTTVLSIFNIPTKSYKLPWVIRKCNLPIYGFGC